MNTFGLANGKAAAKLISGNGISLSFRNKLNDRIAYTKQVKVSTAGP
jgi:hypothetical protein